jgi:hypothetical protein
MAHGQFRCAIAQTDRRVITPTALVWTRRCPKTRSKRFLSVADINDIINRYQAGDTTQKIGTHYGISKTRVARVLRDQGVTIRRQGLTTGQAKKAIGFYATGKSPAWIGAQFGVSHTTIATELRKQGVQLRPRPGWR